MKKSQSSEYFNRLEKGLVIDEEGNVSVGKNLEADGNVFTLNGKKWGMFPVRSGNADEIIDEGFILTSDAPYLQPVLKELTVKGLWISGDVIKVSKTPSTSFVVVDPITNFENGVLTIGDNDYENFDVRFKEL